MANRSLRMRPLIGLDFFHERVTDSLKCSALDLAAAKRFMDDPAHVAGHGGLYRMNFESIWVHFHLEDIGAPAIGRIGGALVGFLVESLPLRRLMTHGLLETPLSPHVFRRRFAKAPIDIVVARPLVEMVTKLGSRTNNGAANDQGRSRGNRRSRVGDQRRVGLRHDDVRQLDTRRSGSHLRKHGRASLSHLERQRRVSRSDRRGKDAP